jgi:lipid-A-disaccharide synthase
MAEELSRDRSYRVILVLTPCQYVSGKESEFARGLKGISEIIPANEYKKWAFFNRKPKQVKFAGKGVVLFLGGDMAHAMLVARKLHYPAFAYIGERIAWKNFYKKFFVPDQEAYEKFKNKAAKDKLKVVGNLMVDSVSELKKWHPEDNVITFMPGSRKWEIDYMTPLYQEVMGLIRKESKNVKFQVVSSPFIKAHPIEGAKLIEFDDIYNSGIIVTIPGTNTAKIAARGIPMVVVFPLNHPEVIPLDGLADLIGRLPVMGKAFKKWVANTVNRKTNFFALPNQKAGREIVPEIRGVVDPLGIALKTLLLLYDREKREQMSAELIEAMGKPGAARRIAEEIHASI